jgi:hypothetical protein
MPISSNEIAAGKCYLSNMNFVRHVLSVDNEGVTFEERGTKVTPLPWGKREAVSVQTFADDVTGEVAQSFDPEVSTNADEVGSVTSQHP